MDKRIKVIGENIRRIRKEHDYTIEYVAEMANISSAHLQRIESLQKGISISCLYRIADVLEVYPEFLLYDQNVQSNADNKIKGYIYKNLRLLEQLYTYIENLLKEYCK